MKTLLAVALVPLLFLADARLASREPERVDTNHSTCGFSVPILGGLSQVTGKFSAFAVELEFDPADPTAATVSVVIDATSVDTGIDDRDAHLNAPDFFDTANHPEITFVSKSVSEKDGDRLEVTGDLTVRDVTREVVLAVELHYPPGMDVTTVGFTARTTLDRTVFGVSYQHQQIADFIAHEVDVVIHTYARLR
jgi:polyisoprenoid-binding protein YceI